MTSRSHLPSSMHLWRDGSNTGIRQSVCSQFVVKSGQVGDYMQSICDNMVTDCKKVHPNSDR